MRGKLALAVWLLLMAGSPALAMVEDSAGALAPGEAQALDRKLAELGPHHFDVRFVERAPEGAVAAAERLFAQRKLGPSDGAIVISLGDRAVGVHLGAGFAERGVGQAEIQRAIIRRFAPAARRGDFAGGVLALASGLVQAGAQPGGSATAPASGEAPGFPWWLVLIPVGAGAFFLWRGRRGSSDLSGRLQALRQRQGQLLEGALKLDEASRLARFQAGTTAETYSKLARRAGTLLGEAGTFGERVDQAEGMLKHGRQQEARAVIEDLEGQVLPLSSEVAAAVTGLDAMSDDAEESVSKLATARQRLAGLHERGVPDAHLVPLEARLQDGERLAAGQDPTAALLVAEQILQELDRVEGRIVNIEPAIAWAELPDHAEELARRLVAMRSTYRELRERAEAAGIGDEPMLANHLDTAERALTTAPVDLAKAKQAMAGAQDDLKGYIGRVEAESHRRAAQQATAPMPMPMWMPGPIILLNNWGDHSRGGGFGASGGGDWGGGDWGGMSGGGDWGGGSSGGGDW